MAPTTPSYARAMKSFALKASPKSEKKKKTVEETNPAPRLSGHSGLIKLIKPSNPKKPCKFGQLPAEIRDIIYGHVLASQKVYIRDKLKYPASSIWPPLLHICRLIRYEAAYTFYGNVPFRFDLITPDFGCVKKWMKRLPVSHRHHLTRNKNIEIHLPRAQQIFTQMDLWNSYRRFSQLYGANPKHWQHFTIMYCLADWFLWCEKPVHSSIKWHYTFGGWPQTYSWNPGRTYHCSMLQFLMEVLAVFCFPCVRDLNTISQRAIMKREALRMLDELNSDYFHKRKSISPGRPLRGYEIGEWEDRVLRLRRAFEKW